jgi:hypothetical protein
VLKLIKQITTKPIITIIITKDDDDDNSGKMKIKLGNIKILD